MQQDVQGKVDSRAMREVNRSIVLDIIRRGGRVSRTDLARRSALTKPTVSAIVEDLLARGIVQEVGYGKTVASGGRRARLLEFNDASAAYLGIRFGVHQTTVGVADARGELRARREIATPPGDARAACAAALAVVDAVCAEAGFPRDRIQAAGITVPGLVDYATGTVALAPNLEWKDVPLRDLFASALGVPVVVNNVTNAGAIAEGRAGVTKGIRSFVWVHVGSGVGAGIVVGGQVFPGTQGFSGEIGHCSVSAGGPKCGCGMHGCLETLASGPAIARIAQEAVARGEKSSLSSCPEIDAAVVAREARAGDPLAKRIFEEAGAHLGVGISYLANILDPEMIVLGGNVMQAGDLLLDSARRTMAQRSLKGSRIPVVASSLLGDNAGLIGSVFAAMDTSVRSYRVVATGERVALG